MERVKNRQDMRVLVAEDSKLYQHLIGSCLNEWGFDFMIANDGNAAREILESSWAPTAAILDWVLPDLSGLELCRRIRARAHEEEYIYSIVLTAKNQAQDLLAAMEAGADDFLSKPFDPPELRARLLVGQRINLLQRQLIAARESLRFAATHDSMTGLLNRGESVSVLQREIARGRRERRSVGVVLADLDHFKRINDSHGHSSGDAVLVEASRRLRSQLREYDGVGRFGGEEFILILPGTSLATATQRAQSLLMSFENRPFETPQGPISVTMSMGVTIAEYDCESSIEAMLEEADSALYRAKRGGRNRVECFAPAVCR